MSMSHEIRVGVLGAGLMGADHIARLERVTKGAGVSAIVEPDAARAAAAKELTRGAATFASLEEALAADSFDALLIATPGFLHEPALLAAIAAGIPTLCEKPLTPDPESARRVLAAEQAGGRRLIQVGFMRRFDAGYAELRELIASGESGELLMLRGVHRNPSVPDSYTQPMLVNDSLVHEFDVMPWLAGSPLRSVEIRKARRNPNGPAHLHDPILAVFELESGVLVDVELNVSVRFGYQVQAEAVFDSGLARIGRTSGIETSRDGRISIAENQSFAPRFRAAYDAQMQAWVDSVQAGAASGPSAWDGYQVALACEAGLRALEDGGVVEVAQEARPAFYS